MSTDTELDEPQSNKLVTYTCPNCEQMVGVEAQLFGEIINCPECSQVFKVAPPVVRPTSDEGITKEEIARIEQSADDETQLQVLHPAMLRNHPIWYLSLLALIVVGISYPIYAYSVYESESWNYVTIGSILAATGFVWLAIWWIRVMAVTLILTSKRIILRKGIISKASSEVQYDDVRNIQVDQTMFGRLLGVGNIAISSSGQDDLEVVAKGIPDPEGIAEQIRRRQ